MVERDSFAKVEEKKRKKKTPVTVSVCFSSVCVWACVCAYISHVLGQLWKLSEETDSDCVVTLCLWTFYYVKGKLLVLMSQCFIMSYHWKSTSSFPSHDLILTLQWVCAKVDSFCWYMWVVVWVKHDYIATQDLVLTTLWSSPSHGWRATNLMWFVVRKQPLTSESSRRILGAWVAPWDRELWSSNFGPQPFYRLLSCFVELFNRFPVNHNDREELRSLWNSSLKIGQEKLLLTIRRTHNSHQMCPFKIQVKTICKKCLLCSILSYFMSALSIIDA